MYRRSSGHCRAETTTRVSPPSAQLSTPLLIPSANPSVSLHERYAHVPIITRHAHTVTYLFRYGCSVLPSTRFLHSRVINVQQAVHHLWSEVVDGDTRKPSLQLKPEGPWAPEEIVRDDVYARDMGKGAIMDDVALEARILAVEIARMKGRVADGGPAWQVTRYFPTKSVGSAQAPNISIEPRDPDKDGHDEPPSYIAISAYHHLLDGTGGLRLSLALLSDYAVIPSPGLAPRMEDLFSVSPSPLYLANAVLKELVIPVLPSTIRSVVQPGHCWPSNTVVGSPTEFREAQVALHIPASWIGMLKRAGKANGVPTLHPIIETAFVFALHEVVGSLNGHFQVATPADERDGSDPAHPQVGGVIHSVLRIPFSHLDLPPRHTFTDKKPALQQASFWSLARRTATHHSSPTERKKGRYEIGLMRYIPDPKNFYNPNSNNPKRRTKTGWEEFLWSAIERPAPYRTSLVVSNLGKVQRLPPRCEGMRWSQSAVPFDDAVMVCLVGHDKGMEASVAFRAGCAITEKQVERVLGRFEDILSELIWHD